VNTGLQELLKNFQQKQQQEKSGEAAANSIGRPELAKHFGGVPVNLQEVLVKGYLDQQKAEQIQKMKTPEQPKLSPMTTKYLDELQKNVSSAETVKDIGEQMLGMVDDVSGYGKYIQGKAPAPLKSEAVANFQGLALDLLPHYKSLFPRGITQVEFKKLSEEGLPQVGLSAAANRARIQKFMNRAEKMLAKKQRLEQVREKYGYIPENAPSLIGEENEKTGKELTIDMAAKFKKAAGGDKEKARKMAKDAGYDF
jgi:hypothetical protein